VCVRVCECSGGLTKKLLRHARHHSIGEVVPMFTFECMFVCVLGVVCVCVCVCVCMAIMKREDISSTLQ
jgi:hypothetical protein